MWFIAGLCSSQEKKKNLILIWSFSGSYQLFSMENCVYLRIRELLYFVIDVTRLWGYLSPVDTVWMFIFRIFSFLFISINETFTRIKTRWDESFFDPASWQLNMLFFYSFHTLKQRIQRKNCSIAIELKKKNSGQLDNRSHQSKQRDS